MKINGWRIQQIKAFEQRYNELVSQVKDLSEKDPKGYKFHPATKLLKSIQETIKNIAQDPFDKKFRLGKALGAKYTHWRRAKNLLPSRYRLFFRAHTPDQIIILAWVNDDNTLRKEGDKKDVYSVFEHMLDAGIVPNDLQSLKEQAKDPPQRSE